MTIAITERSDNNNIGDSWAITRIMSRIRAKRENNNSDDEAN